MFTIIETVRAWVHAHLEGLYNRITHGGSIVTAIFATLSLQDWGFLLGTLLSAIISVVAAVLAERARRRRTRIYEEEQRRRTDILLKYVAQTQAKGDETPNPAALAMLLKAADAGDKP